MKVTRQLAALLAQSEMQRANLWSFNTDKLARTSSTASYYVVLVVMGSGKATELAFLDSHSLLNSCMHRAPSQYGFEAPFAASDTESLNRMEYARLRLAESRLTTHGLGEISKRILRLLTCIRVYYYSSGVGYM